MIGIGIPTSHSSRPLPMVFLFRLRQPGQRRAGRSVAGPFAVEKLQRGKKVKQEPFVEVGGAACCRQPHDHLTRYTLM
jgi:hypothetical protein